MNWRWTVPVLLGVALLELGAGVMAYNTSTWDLSHTEVLTGWAAVREVCLVFVPLFLAAVLPVAGLLLLAVGWSMRGGR
jgi:hypothetical protein